MSFANLRLLIFLPAVLIPAGASSSPAFCTIYCAYKLSKQGDNIQSWWTPFPIWNHSVVPCLILTVASWRVYRFLRRQVRWSGILISFRIFQSVVPYVYPDPNSRYQWICACMPSHSVVSNSFVTPWTVVCQPLRCMGFSRQEYWTGCHFFLRGIFLPRGSNLYLFIDKVDSLPLSHLGSPTENAPLDDKGEKLADVIKVKKLERRKFTRLSRGACFNHMRL